MRLRALDVLRAVAVLTIIVHHTPRDFLHLGLLQPAVAEFQLFGWIAVDMFFVLSGYLVSGLLFSEYRKTGEVHVGRFLIRRGFKIYPGFYAMLAATVVMQVLGKQLVVKALLIDSLFLQSYLKGSWDHTWSLAVEEHFYFFISFLIWMRVRARPKDPFRGFPGTFLLFAAMALGLRLYTSIALPFNYHTHHFPTHLRMDSLFFGVLLSYWHHFDRARMTDIVARYRWPIVVLSFVCLAPAFFLDVPDSFFMHTYGHTVLYLGFGGILCAALQTKAPSNRLLSRLTDAAAFIGRHSYSIYLWHIPVRVWYPVIIKRVAPGGVSEVTKLGVYFSLSVLVGIVLAKLIEIPFLEIRDRMFPSLSGGLAAERQRPPVALAS
jgi:peptidoglycan/LPS O-acetylase OafA/YrhL